jgi:hypothetical protein
LLSAGDEHIENGGQLTEAEKELLREELKKVSTNLLFK